MFGGFGGPGGGSSPIPPGPPGKCAWCDLRPIDWAAVMFAHASITSTPGKLVSLSREAENLGIHLGVHIANIYYTDAKFFLKRGEDFEV